MSKYATLPPVGRRCFQNGRKPFEEICRPTGLPAQARKADPIERIATGALRPHSTHTPLHRYSSVMSGRTFTLPEMSGKPFEQMCDTTPQCGVPSKLMENGASGILVPDVSCGFGSDPGHPKPTGQICPVLRAAMKTQGVTAQILFENSWKLGTTRGAEV